MKNLNATYLPFVSCDKLLKMISNYIEHVFTVVYIPVQHGFALRRCLEGITAATLRSIYKPVFFVRTATRMRTLAFLLEPNMTAKELLSLLNERFRKNNPVEAGMLIDDKGTTVKKAVADWLEKQSKRKRAK